MQFSWLCSYAACSNTLWTIWLCFLFFYPVILLSSQLSLFISFASDVCATVHFPPCNLSICRNGSCTSVCVYICVLVHWVIGNVVFKDDDYSGPCGSQTDKVMMAATFSAISSQSSWSKWVCKRVCVLMSRKWTCKLGGIALHVHEQHCLWMTMSRSGHVVALVELWFVSFPIYNHWYYWLKGPRSYAAN